MFCLIFMYRYDQKNRWHYSKCHSDLQKLKYEAKHLTNDLFIYKVIEIKELKEYSVNGFKYCN